MEYYVQSSDCELLQCYSNRPALADVLAPRPSLISSLDFLLNNFLSQLWRVILIFTLIIGLVHRILLTSVSPDCKAPNGLE